MGVFGERCVLVGEVIGKSEKELQESFEGTSCDLHTK